MTRSDPSISLVANGGGFRLAQTLAGLGLLLLLVYGVGAAAFATIWTLVAGLALLLIALFLSEANPTPRPRTRTERNALVAVMVGFGFAVVALTGAGWTAPTLLFWLSTGLVAVGTVAYARARYGPGRGGVRNDDVQRTSLTSGGALGWMLGIVMTGFYVLLYWFPASLEGLIRTMDPLSWALRGSAADQWFMYGTFYTVAVLVMGVRALYRYRHSRYQVVRTLSVMFFQTILAYVIPQLLVLFNSPEFYFSYFWPLKPEYLWPGDYGFGWILRDGGRLGVFMVFWGALMTFVATPVLTYFFGKRWYCSWVCGCGCLAETMGDPFRHLSDKSLGAWKVERWMIHGVLVFVIMVTAMLWINSATGGAVLGAASGPFSRAYGFLISSVFAGVIGVGFYPLMGSRVWCRFGCPMAAILGLFQKYFSRFRITTNGGQCISCGNCSTYCEMGIDVRWYAQRGQNIVRASCVGCGICATVCPRGVLSLENGPREGRLNGPVLIEADQVGVMAEDWRSAAPRI